MRIIRSRYAGACYGVERALSLVDDAAREGAGAVHTLGPLIHNPQVVSDLRQRGVAEASSVDDVEAGVLVIRSHGVVPDVIDRARARGLRVIDATCPHVSKAHAAARELREQGCRVIVVGEPGHPEVEGIRAWAGGDAIVAQEAADLPADLAADLPADLAADLPADLAAESEAGQGGADKVGVVVQTTQSAAALAAIIEALHERDISPIVRDTICFATRQRQEAAMDLAARVDIMLVVGGRNSGNTTRLAQLCQAVCPRTYHIEGASELMPSWFEGVETVGITAGASTPESQIIAVEQALQDAENESRERGEGGLSMEAASL